MKEDRNGKTKIDWELGQELGGGGTGTGVLGCSGETVDTGLGLWLCW